MSDSLFVGIDLAWKAKARTGLAAVDSSGRLRRSGSAITDDDIAAWLEDLGGRVIVSAVDAPLIVPNASGQRVPETLIARAFGAYGASPYSSSKLQPLFDPPRAHTLAKRLGWTEDPDNHGSREIPACIEVYPHPAMIGLFALGQRVLYKKGPDRAAGFRSLVDHFETIQVLDLPNNERWHELREVIADPRPGDLARIEDEMDAILCAHLAWLWHHHPDRLAVYGSLEEGFIVAPPPPTHPASPTPRPQTSATPSDVVPRPSAIISALRDFMAERDWDQFHSPDNLAKSISIEAGELLECFQWNADADIERVRGELADVLTYCHLLTDKLGLDADQIVLDKLAVTRAKYPVEKARGRSTKYDEL